MPPLESEPGSAVHREELTVLRDPPLPVDAELSGLDTDGVAPRAAPRDRLVDLFAAGSEAEEQKTDKRYVRSRVSLEVHDEKGLQHG